MSMYTKGYWAGREDQWRADEIERLMSSASRGRFWLGWGVGTTVVYGSTENWWMLVLGLMLAIMGGLNAGTSDSEMRRIYQIGASE